MPDEMKSTNIAKGIRVSVIAEQYSDFLWPNKVSRLTNKKFLARISSLIPDSFTEISSNDLILIAEQLLDMGFKPSTVNRHLSAFTKLLRHAQENGFIPNVPVFHQLKDSTDQLRYLSKVEEARLFKSIGELELHYLNLSIFLVETGVTLGEAASLYWENFLDRGVIIPANSKNEGRRLPLTKSAMQSIAALSAESSGPFRRISQQTFRRVWNIALEEAELKDSEHVVPTVLRHTCASRLIISGMDMRLVQKWLGNKNYQSMIRYEQLLNLNNFSHCRAALEAYSE